jgi:ketosteroid isomerase-like protein
VTTGATVERATEFGEAWNGRDVDKVLSYFTDDAVMYITNLPKNLGTPFAGKEQIAAAVQSLWSRYPDGQFTNLKVTVTGDFGTFDYDFVATDQDGVRQVYPGADVLEFRGDMVYRKLGFVATVK